MSTQHLDSVVAQLRQLAVSIDESDELEEITDVLIDLLVSRLPIPRWIPFLRGRIRKSLDAWLPHGLFQLVELAIKTVRDRGRFKGPQPKGPKS